MSAKLAMCLSGLVALSACGGSGAIDSVTNPDAFYRTNQPLQNDMTTTLNGLSNSAFTAVQTTGTATYNGYTKVVVDTPTTPIELLGLAAMNANFTTQTISGNLTNFAGNYQDTTTTPVTLVPPAVSYAGSIAVTNGCIGVTNGCTATRANQFVADFNGTLTGQGNTLGLTGGLTGDFKGTTNAGTQTVGILATATSGAPTLNGSPENGQLFIAAARQ